MPGSASGEVHTADGAGGSIGADVEGVEEGAREVESFSGVAAEDGFAVAAEEGEAAGAFRIGAVGDFHAIGVVVIVRVLIGRIGAVCIDFCAIGQSIEVGIRAERIRREDEDFRPIGEAVAIGVREAGVRARGQFHAILEAVVIGVVLAGDGLEGEFRAIDEAVAVGIAGPCLGQAGKMEGFPCIREAIAIGVVGAGGNPFHCDALPDGVAVAAIEFAVEVAHDDIEGVIAGGQLLREDDTGVVPVRRKRSSGSGNAKGSEFVHGG